MDDIYDYMCEELLDRVRRRDIPVYQAMLDLSNMTAIGVIPMNKFSGCRRELQAILEERADRQERDNDQPVGDGVTDDTAAMQAIYDKRYKATDDE